MQTKENYIDYGSDLKPALKKPSVFKVAEDDPNEPNALVRIPFLVSHFFLFFDNAAVLLT